MYGGKRKSVPPRLAALSRLDRPFLHAYRLTFAHPADGRSLSFEAPYLIEKLVKDHICASEDEARALFREVKRYLFLNRSDQTKIWEMYSFRVDEAWHQFVLFTRQYIDFCMRHYGMYLPHSPSNAPETAKGSAARDFPVATFKEFHAYYEQVFGEPLPDLRRGGGRHLGPPLVEQRADLFGRAVWVVVQRGVLADRVRRRPPVGPRPG